MDEPGDWVRCELCGRDVPPEMITRHHLTPRQKGGKAEDRVPLCRLCHKQIHAVFSNKQLAGELARIEALRAAPQLASFLAWVRKQSPGRNIRTRMAVSHPERKRRRQSRR